MKKIVLLFMVVLVHLSFSQPAHSAGEVADGTSTLRDCSLALEMTQDKYPEHAPQGAEAFPPKEQQTKAIQCFSYVVGFKDALYVDDIFRMKSGKERSICMPVTNINNELAVRIAVKYLQDNPQLLSKPRSALLFNAFFYAFPCGK